MFHVDSERNATTKISQLDISLEFHIGLALFDNPNGMTLANVLKMLKKI